MSYKHNLKIYDTIIYFKITFELWYDIFEFKFSSNLHRDSDISIIINFFLKIIYINILMTKNAHIYIYIYIYVYTYIH